MEMVKPLFSSSAKPLHKRVPQMLLQLCFLTMESHLHLRIHGVTQSEPSAAALMLTALGLSSRSGELVAVLRHSKIGFSMPSR